MRHMMNHSYQRSVSGCGLIGYINLKGEKTNGEAIIRAAGIMHERTNGLGGGFAGYGIYPEYKDYYAFHLMYYTRQAKVKTDKLIEDNFEVEKDEVLPTKQIEGIVDPPGLWRYFVKPQKHKLVETKSSEDDFVMNLVMKINSEIKGAYVFSSGKNMGAFKAVGYAEDVGKFYRLEEYEAYTWIGHGRFPTNTPGWWGGAHPFTLLDWSVVHNGEISSYGINKRYLEMFGYKCTLLTDTEVVTYLLDLLVRRHKLPIEIAAKALAAPFWKDIDRMQNPHNDILRAIRMIYGSSLLNGPFAIIFGYSKGMVGLNDRVKLRPMVAARKDDFLYISSEECAVREICPKPNLVWAPKAGEPVIGNLEEENK